MMNWLLKNLRFVLLFPLFGSVGVAAAEDMEITPFSASDQSPLVQIYGLPHDTGSDIVPPGTFRIALNQDLTNNSTASSNTREQITLDGETYRLAFIARYGVAPRWETGIEIPYLFHGGGFLDSFISTWHNIIGVHQRSRENAPKYRMEFSYRKDGIQEVLLDHATSGIGDIILTGGFSLYDVRNAESQDRLALKGGIKFPTGDSSNLLGSGSTDGMLQLCGSMNRRSGWGTLGMFGSIGGVAMSRSDVLRDQHNPIAGVGTLGFGWGPASWISYKIQLNAHTPLYHGSSLVEISKESLLLIFGGRLRLPAEYLLDIGVEQNMASGTAPDVSFHLGLSKYF